MAEIQIEGKEAHTNGNPIAVNEQAPNFLLVDQSLEERSLTDYQGKKKLIYAAPSLDTGVCLLSTKKFNDHAKSHPDCVFIIVTADLPFALKRVCGLEKLENVVPLSMMRNRDFARDYGVYLSDGPLEGLSARAVFVLDEDNKVIYSELVPEITHEPNYDTAFAALQ